MSNKFKGFMDRQEAELARLNGDNDVCFDRSVLLFGSRSFSTRQPPEFHAMLATMAEYIPLTTKAEILYMALTTAFEELKKEVDHDVQDKFGKFYLDQFQNYCTLINQDKGGDE